MNLKKHEEKASKFKHIEKKNEKNKQTRKKYKKNMENTPEVRIVKIGVSVEVIDNGLKTMF